MGNLLGLKTEKTSWVSDDESLKNFFRDEIDTNKYKHEERLSASVGNGF